MTIVPEDKDWTWVLGQACPDCGFDARLFDPAETAEVIEEIAANFIGALQGPNVALRTTPDLWSTLEYACHVRDVFRLCEYRVNLMLAEDNPQFANWDQDATAIEERYDLQDPTAVAHELRDAQKRASAAFRAVAADQWQRPGRRSDNKSFTIDTFARYMTHDPVHHLWDIGAPVPAAGQAPKS
jgi:DinB superfamily